MTHRHDKSHLQTFSLHFKPINCFSFIDASFLLFVLVLYEILTKLVSKLKTTAQPRFFLHSKSLPQPHFGEQNERGCQSRIYVPRNEPYDITKKKQFTPFLSREVDEWIEMIYDPT